jgi:hypothetical protein
MISLAKIAKKYTAKSDEELEAKIEELQAERRAFSQEHARGPFPETRHEQLSKAIEEREPPSTLASLRLQPAP